MSFWNSESNYKLITDRQESATGHRLPDLLSIRRPITVPAFDIL